MITVAIIGVLAAIAIPSYQTYMLKAQVASLVKFAEAGQVAIVEYVTGTGDSTCSNFYTNYPQYGYNYVSTMVDPATTFQIAYGNIGPIFQVSATCGSLAGKQIGNLADFDYIFIGNIAKMLPDGTLAWSCAYAYSNTAKPSQAQVKQAVPAGCVQLRGNNGGGSYSGGYGGGGYGGGGA